MAWITSGVPLLEKYEFIHIIYIHAVKKNSYKEQLMKKLIIRSKSKHAIEKRRLSGVA